MEFLLSLSTKAKEKLAKAKLPDNLHKSVMYADQALSEDDVSSFSKYFNSLFNSLSCLSKFTRPGATLMKPRLNGLLI